MLHELIEALVTCSGLVLAVGSHEAWKDSPVLYWGGMGVGVFLLYVGTFRL